MAKKSSSKMRGKRRGKRTSSRRRKAPYDHTLRASAVRREARKLMRAMDAAGYKGKARTELQKLDAWWRRPDRTRDGTMYDNDPMGYVGEASLSFGAISGALGKGQIPRKNFPVEEFHGLEDALDAARGSYKKLYSEWPKDGSPSGGPLTGHFLTQPYDAWRNPATPTAMQVGGIAAIGFTAWRFYQKRQLRQQLLALGFSEASVEQFIADNFSFFSFQTAASLLKEISAP